MSRSAMLVVLALALSSSPAFAQSPIIESQTLIALGTQLAQQVTIEKPDLPIAFNVEVRGQSRPAALLPLYAAQAVLHGLDVYSTRRALENGSGREANPMFKGGNRSLMVGAKIAAASINILAAERLWKKHRKLAMTLMIATNTVMSGVVANNFRLGR